MNVLIKADQVLPILYGLNVEYGKKYCFPGQRKILSLLVDFRDFKLSIASINRWLRVLEDEGYIRRTRRISHHKKLGTIFRSTLYHITKKGYRRLAKFIDGVWEWYKKTNGNGAERKNESKGWPIKHQLQEPDQKLKDLAMGALKKAIY